MSRGYGSSRIGLGRRPALLIVDMQALLADSASPMYGGQAVDAAVASAALLLRAVRDLGLPVFYTTVGYRADEADMALWTRKVAHLKICVAGSRWTRIPELLAPRPDEIVLPKRMASAFFGTDLLPLLMVRGVDSLIVCGATTGGCVRASVVDAFQNGFRTLVPEEYCADMDELAHTVNLSDMNKRYADVLSLAQLLEELEAGRPW